eukprot:2289293-Rhodomonas_salina.1
MLLVYPPVNLASAETAQPNPALTAKVTAAPSRAPSFVWGDRRERWRESAAIYGGNVMLPFTEAM